MKFSFFPRVAFFALEIFFAVDGAAVAPNPGTPSTLSGTALQIDYTAPDSPGYGKAAFHFWSPAYSGSLRGLIVMTPGIDDDGRGMTNDPDWQALAKKYQFGLVASYMTGGHYQRPDKGTGDAFRSALKHFADESGHAEITTVPLLLWGISAGGQWNYNYMLWRPDDVMAFVVNKGGVYDENDEPDEHARSTPGLFILGASDEIFRVHAITRIWKNGRKLGALWALAPQPGSGHEFSKTDPLARTFFDSVLKARMPDPNDLSITTVTASTLKPMQENAGWLGNLTTHEIHDDSNDPDVDRTAAWLPDQTTAQAWKVFVSGG